MRSEDTPQLAAATAVIVAAFNEEESVAVVVADIRQHFTNVIVVDDGSVDETADRARSAGAVVLRHPVNLGQGAALETGVRYALTRQEIRFFVTFDADGQHRAEDAYRLLVRLHSAGVDVVLGTRFVGGGVALVPRSRRLVLRLARAYSNRATGLQLTDAHNGLRAFSRLVAEEVHFRHSGMAHASEFIEMVASMRFSVMEEPVTIQYTAYSRRKGQSAMNAVNVAFDLFWRR